MSTQCQHAEGETWQGAVISPILANIYLHYVLDTWAQHWRQHQARGHVILIRYADDSVLGFQFEDEAKRFLEALQARLSKFRLALHPQKTRLIEFGRHAEQRRRSRGQGKPGTFDFLGFTHCCSKTRKGGFKILRLTVKKRLRPTLAAIREKLKKRRHDSKAQVGNWLKSVLRGYYNYFAVPDNLKRLEGFRREVSRAWRAALASRSQKGRRMAWARFERLEKKYLPMPRRVHPYPYAKVRVMTQGKSRMRQFRMYGSVRGGPGDRHSYRDRVAGVPACGASVVVSARKASCSVA